MSVSLKRVLSRWGVRVVTAGASGPIPHWVFEWGAGLERQVDALRLAYIGEKEFYAPTKLLDPETFSDAKDSLNALLPKFQSMLRAKFGERYHAVMSQTSTRIYYFFSAPSALESFSISLLVKHGNVHLALGYVPARLVGQGLDYSKMVEEQENVGDPDLTGLALMRLTRKLLSRV